MGLLNNQGAGAPASGVQGNAASAPAAAPVDNAELAKKRADAKAAKEAAKVVVRAYFEPLRANMKADIIAAFELLTKAAKAGGGGVGEPIFDKIFGSNPQVGQSVTVGDVFNKLYKGIDYMNSKCRIWKQKNVAIVKYVHNPQNPIQSQYVIEKIGA